MSRPSLDALKIDRAEAPAGGVSRAWWLVPLVLVALAAVAVEAIGAACWVSWRQVVRRLKAEPAEGALDLADRAVCFPDVLHGQFPARVFQQALEAGLLVPEFPLQASEAHM